MSSRHDKNTWLCSGIVLRSWVPIHCQTESWRYDMSSELSLRLSPQRPSDRKASTWANMSRGLCHTSPTHRYSLLLWRPPWELCLVAWWSCRVGVVFGSVFGLLSEFWGCPSRLCGYLVRSKEALSVVTVNAQSTLSQRYSQRSLKCIKMYSFAKISLIYIKKIKDI